MNADDATSVLDGSTQAYTTAYLRLESSIPGYRSMRNDGLQLVHYGRPKAGVNREIIAGSTRPEQVLNFVSRHPEYDEAFISTFTERDEGDEDEYDAANYTRVVRNFLMRCDISPQHPTRASRSGDAVVHVTTTEDIVQLAALRDDGQILPDYLSDPTLRCYALMVDDIPAASAMLVDVGGSMAVIEYVHTVELYRRRGYGRWLMRALHREAADLGAQAVVLSSNDTGRPLYEALGYTFLCYEDVYRR